MTRFRWIICALLFAATMVNYMDRQSIALLKPLLTEKFGWSQIDYANIVFAFQLAYAIGYLLAGRLIDRIGVKMGLSLAVGLWSLACMGHGLAGSVVAFCLARIGLGLAQGGHFPGAIKSVGEWFPKSERALATGIFNSGTNVGAMTAPFVVPWLALRYGWQAAFVALGLLGFVWIVVWWLAYRPTENTLPVVVAGAGSAEKTSWLKLLTYRPTWAFTLAMFLVSPIWWFYLFWAPSFLNERHGLNITEMGWPLVLIYSMTTVGSVGGGWLSSALMKRGWSVNAFPQVRDAGLRTVYRSGLLGGSGRKPLGCGGADRAGGGGPSGLFRESFHAGFRHDAASCREQCGRHWRHGRLVGRDGCCESHGICFGVDR